MSFIPARKMPHITAKSGEFDAETGKIVHLNPEPQAAEAAAPSRGISTFGWVAGAAGVVATAGAIAAFLTLRSSSAKPARRRIPASAKKTPTTRRRRTTTTAKRKTAA